MASDRPNILMVTIDSARYDRLGVHGYARSVTPHLDSLAQQAVDYTNANAPAAWTRPAMGAIFTGMFPHAFGFEQMKFPDRQHTFLAQRLKAVGYETFLFSNNPYVSPSTALDSGFDRVCYFNRRTAHRVVRKSTLARCLPSIARMVLARRATLKVLTNLVVDEAAHALQRQRSGDPPFFVYVHIEVHHPYLSDRRYLGKVLDPGVTEECVREVEMLQRRTPSLLEFARTDLPEEQRRRYFGVLRSMYDASFLKADEHVGRLISILRAKDLWSGCAVVITSDHGEHLGERGLTGHGLFPYEENMHVPLLIKYPGGIKRPGADHDLVSTIDIAPTLCALAGADFPSDQGQALSLLDTPRHDLVSWERHNFETGYESFKEKHPNVDWERYNLGYVVALKDGRCKYVWTSAGPQFLFDLRQDPGEQTNLAHSEPDLLSHYQGRFRDWQAGMTVRAGTAEESYEAAVLDHLRDLGYIE
jgi:arylsulfatase A-like enzyme